jgi:hypothetical protein
LVDWHDPEFDPRFDSEDDDPDDQPRLNEIARRLGVQAAKEFLVAGNFRVRYGWLYVRYDERFWYWEFVTMARKLAFVAIGLIPHKVAVWALYSSGTLLALASQLKLTPLAGRDYGGRLDSVWCLSQYRRQWIQERAGGSANFAESFNLLVQTVTLGLGGFFAFDVVDEKNEASVAAKVISVVLIGINLVTLIPALRLVYTAAKTRCCKAEGGDANMALLGGSE